MFDDDSDIDSRILAVFAADIRNLRQRVAEVQTAPEEVFNQAVRELRDAEARLEYFEGLPF